MRADNSLVFESPSYVLGEHFIVRKEASGGQRGSRKRRLRRAPGCIWEALCGDRRGRISRAVRDLGGNDPTATLTHRAANGGSLPPRPRFGPRLSLLRFLASLFFSPDSLHCFCCFCLTRQGRNSRETTARVGRRPARQRVAPSTPSPVGFLRRRRSGRDSYSSGFDALAYSSHAAPACACVVGCEFFWSTRHWLGEVPSQWWKARKKELASS